MGPNGNSEDLFRVNSSGRSGTQNFEKLMNDLLFDNTNPNNNSKDNLPKAGEMKLQN